MADFWSINPVAIRSSLSAPLYSARIDKKPFATAAIICGCVIMNDEVNMASGCDVDRASLKNSRDSDGACRLI